MTYSFNRCDLLLFVLFSAAIRPLVQKAFFFIIMRRIYRATPKLIAL